ncbi:hypothetical protein FRB93_003032 [Tulasnella sp. JGI-2019a]|nr:hypothetical protein FRB93_003032 [Tulasnella sp. JGI-2019a]
MKGHAYQSFCYVISGILTELSSWPQQRQLPFLCELPFEPRESEHEANTENENDPDSHSARGGWYPLTEQTLPESIDTSIWNLLLFKYAHKITRLTLNSALRGPSIHLLATLLHKSPCSVLCPNLRSLRIDMAPYSERLHAMAIPILCGSSVTNVEMQRFCRTNDNPVIVAEHLGLALKTCGSKIQRVVLGYSKNYYNTFTPDFSLFNHLTEVRLRNVSCDGWQKLAENCPQLLEASVTEVLREPRRSESIGDPTKSIDFPLLRKLRIVSISLVNGILLESNMPALENLIVRRPVQDADGTISTQLAKRSRLLQEVELRVKHFHGGVGFIIRALSSLCHLRKLKLNGDISQWDVRDGDMDVLARSVPNLQSISITLRQNLSYRKGRIPLTHATLLSLVQHCRQLIEIELPMDLSQVDDSSEKPIGFTPSMTVTSLIFCKMMLLSKFKDDDSPPASQVDGVLAFLACCCPEVRRFQVHELNELEESSTMRTCIEEGFRKYLEDASRRKSVINAL